MGASELSRGAEVGRSTFARATAMIYWMIVLALMFGLATAPGWLVTFFLAPDPSNLPLFVACLLPVGPGLAAMVFAWRRREMEGPDLAPAARFWRGYRLNLVDVLRWWVPYLAVVALAGFVGTHLGLISSPDGTVWVLLALGVLSALWAGHMLILTAVFSFRMRDAARLSLYCFFRCFGSTLLYLSLMVAWLGLTWLFGAWLPLLIAPILGLWYVRAAEPVITLVTTRFTTAEVDNPVLIDDEAPEDTASSY